MSPTSRLLSAAEAATFLHTTAGALAQQRRRHAGPAHEIHNGRVYYRVEDLVPSASASNSDEELRPLLTATQVADLLAVTTSALTHLRARVEGPAWVTIGRNIRYRPADVEQYIAVNTRNAGAR